MKDFRCLKPFGNHALGKHDGVIDSCQQSDHDLGTSLDIEKT